MKIHSRSPAESKTANGEKIFYALLTDGRVYRKIVTFGQELASPRTIILLRCGGLSLGETRDLSQRRRIIVCGEARQASINLQHVEEWKYYELTNLKAKIPRDTETMRTGGLKKDCTQLSEVVALKDIYQFPNEFYTNKSSTSFFSSQKQEKKIREIPKRKIWMYPVSLLFPPIFAEINLLAG